MIVVSDPKIEQEAISMNIKLTRDYFEDLIKSSYGSSWAQTNKHYMYPVNQPNIKSDPFKNILIYQGEKYDFIFLIS